MKHQILTKIHNRIATIAIIGLGYVGLPLAVAFAEAGFAVVGIGVDVINEVCTANHGA